MIIKHCYKNIFITVFLCCANLMSVNSFSPRITDVEIGNLEIKALKGDYKAAMKLADFYGIDKQDLHAQKFWNCIFFENNNEAGSWNFANTNYSGKLGNIRFQYLVFLSESYRKEKRINTYVEQEYEQFHKKYESFSFVSDDNVWEEITDTNIDDFQLNAYSGSGVAAWKLAQYYKTRNNKDTKVTYSRILDFAIEATEDGECTYLYWIRIGAQNGNPKCIEEYTKILKESSDEFDNKRAEFWCNKIKEQS